MSWKRIKELETEKATLLTEIRGILQPSETEKRELTAEESGKFDERHAKLESINGTIARLKQAKDAELRAIAGPGGIVGGIPFPFGPSRDHVLAASGDLSLGIERRMADAVHDHKYADLGQLSIGKFIRGLATGEWGGAEAEQRAMTLGVTASGGVLAPTPLSANIIDLARNKSQVMRAGARTVPMTSSTLKMVRTTGDGAVGWRAENAAFASNDMTFEAMTFTAKTLGGIAKLSIELAEDAAGIDAAVNNSLSSAIALELDRVALRGAGTATEPQGVKGATGVQTIAAGGDLDYAILSRAVQKVREANGEANAAIYAPRTAGDIDRLADTTGQPLSPPPSVRALSMLATNQVPTNLGAGVNESEAFVGDWSQLLYGIRTQLMLEVTRVGADGTNGAFSHGQIWVRAYLRGDVQIARPNHFVYVSGITSPA